MMEIINWFLRHEKLWVPAPLPLRLTILMMEIINCFLFHQKFLLPHTFLANVKGKPLT